MELLQLIYFIDAAQSENFSHTARKYSVPTSNISQTVKRLERELGRELFTRTSNRLTLNSDGRIFLEGAKRSLAALDEAKFKISDINGAVEGEIKLQVLTNRRIVTNAIDKYRRLYPAVSFVIDCTQGGSGYDFIISDAAPGTGYDSELLISERIMLAVADGSEFSKEKFVSLDRLKNARFVNMSRDSRLFKLTESMCHTAGFSPNTVISTDDPYYVRKYVEMGMGVALVPLASWRGLFSDGVSLIDVGDYTRSSYLYYESSRFLTGAARMFKKIIVETFVQEAENS